MELKFFSILFSIILGTMHANAQTLPHTRLEGATLVGNTVEVSVVADFPFYVGNNTFVLVVGGQPYDLYRQTDVDGMGKLTFLVPLLGYNKLTTGDKMYLTYGLILGAEMLDKEQIEACALVPDGCHYLGLFHPKMLSK